MSVIVAVRNGERYLASALRSIREQNYESLEILVVDGNSTDGTSRIARDVEGVRYLMQSDEGLANARNLGVREAKGALIAFLDADDEWLSGKLHRQVEYLGQNPRDSGTVTRLRFLVEPECGRQHPDALAFYQKEAVGYTPGALVARRELFPIVGPFNGAYSVACDADWFVRLTESRVSVPVIEETLLLKRIHGMNMSLRTDLARQETMSMLHKSLHRKRNNGGPGTDGAGLQDDDGQPTGGMPAPGGPRLG